VSYLSLSRCNSFVFFLPFILTLNACASRQVGYEALYWPRPPDRPRYVFEGTLRTGQDLDSYATISRVRDALTGLGPGNTPAFAKPYDLAARSGRLVVTDTIAKSIMMWDIPRRKMYHFGQRGPGLVKKPLGVGMDAKGWVYVADSGDNSVKVYDALGLFVRGIGAPEDFERPVDVAVNQEGNRIYVVDAGGISSNRHRILIYDDKGESLGVIGERGSGFGQFNLPIQAAVSPAGQLHVLDAGNFRVQVFNAEGEYVYAFGQVGRNFGNMARPRGIAIDAEGNVYVSDAAYRNFQVFNSEGQLLMSIGGEQFADKPGHFSLPAGIAVDETNHVYVVDQILAKVDIFRKLDEAEVERAVLVNKVWQIPPLPQIQATEATVSTEAESSDFDF